MIPLYIQILSKLIRILPSVDEQNLSNGEIRKFHFVKDQKNQIGFNDQVVGNKDGYDMIWRHISNDYFKCIGKWPERTC